MFEGTEYKTFEEFLIRNTHFHWVTPWAVFPVPRVRGQRSGFKGALVTRSYGEHTRSLQGAHQLPCVFSLSEG